MGCKAAVMLFLQSLQILMAIMIATVTGGMSLSKEDLIKLDRNVVQMYEMVHTKTECSFPSIMSLAHYGNWCGVGNNGQPPEDEIDACCENHNHCYDTVMTSGDCHLPHPLLVTYSWSPVNGDNSTLICDDCSKEGSSRQTESEDENSSCSCLTCMCDLQLATCLQKADKCPSPLFGLLNRLRK